MTKRRTIRQVPRQRVAPEFPLIARFDRPIVRIASARHLPSEVAQTRESCIPVRASRTVHKPGVIKINRCAYSQ